MQEMKTLNGYEIVDAAARERLLALETNGGGGGEGGGDTSGLAERVTKIEEQLADLLYEAIDITSFNHDAGVKEYGEVVTAVTLSWKINKTPTVLTLDGEVLSPETTFKTFTGLSIDYENNHTWSLSATDERAATDTMVAKIAFYNGIYCGAATEPDEYDSAFILQLKKALRGTKLPAFEATTGEGQYIYYCLPVRMGECSFTLGGFNGGFGLVATIPFTNASGYTENYYIYRSDYANLGTQSVTVT